MRGGRGRTRFPRLTAYDEHCLRVETPERPLQVGILGVLDGRALLDRKGQLRLADVRREIEGRLGALPELRRIVYRPGRLAGRPLWVDDPIFHVDAHVGGVQLAPPGDEAALLALAEQLMARPLDRARPLWRIWFVTGLEGGRVGVLVVVHHALADGMTAMRMVRSLLGSPMTAAGAGPRGVPLASSRPLAGPLPSRAELVSDNLRATLQSALRLLRPSTWRLAASVARSAWRAASEARRAPRSSLNGPVGPRRRLATLRLDLSTVKRVARANRCGVNDVVLGLASGGVRALLQGRGEPVDQLRPCAGVAVALFSAGRGQGAGNDIGTLHVPLPIAEADPKARLPLIAAEKARAKASSMVAAEPILRAWFGRFGVVRRSMEQQRLVNLAETYLPGPPSPVDVLGCRVLDLLPIAPLAGNLGLSFVALSYAGGLAIAVRVDADQFPDLDVLAAALERDWQALVEQLPPAPRRPRRTSRRSATGSAG